MALSRETFTGNGSTQTFAINFDYILTSHIHVYVDNVEDIGITFPTSTTVTLTSAPGVGAVVLVKRETPLSGRLVDYADGSVLSEATMDKDSRQNFFLSQEVDDDFSDALTKSNDGVFDADTTRIKNVSDPTSAQDAATKNYLENTWLSTSDKSNISTVAGISSNVTTVAGIASDVTAVAGDATDIGVVAGVTTEIGRLGTADAVADMAILATTDVVADMAILATTDVVADMNTLGTADVVSDMNTLAVSDVIADMNTLAVSQVITDMNTLGTADVVSDLNTLGTSDAVSDMNTLAAIASDITSVAADATDIGAVAGKATEIGRLGTADAVADLAILATADVVTDMNVLGTADVVSDMNVLGTADVVSDMNTLGTSDNVTNMATVATNIAGVNSFAERYRVEASDPASSLDQGDLVFNTGSSLLKYYNGSAWVAVSAPDVTLADATALAIALG